eukprot:960844-Rhodomonas_salina.1
MQLLRQALAGGYAIADLQYEAIAQVRKLLRPSYGKSGTDARYQVLAFVVAGEQYNAEYYGERKEDTGSTKGGTTLLGLEDTLPYSLSVDFEGKGSTLPLACAMPGTHIAYAATGMLCAARY